MNFKAKKSWRIFSIALAFAFVFTTVSAAALTADAATVKPKSLTISAAAKIVDIGGKVTVKVKSVKPANASKSVTWKSSNKKVATVTSKGVVKGLKKGTVKITATSKADKKVKKTITIKVKNIKPAGVTLNKTYGELNVGETTKLKAAAVPTGVYNKGIVWESDNPEIASVDSKGTVTALKAGSVKITAKTKEGGKSAECTLDIEKVLKPFTMVGFYSTEKINYVDVAENAEVKVWNTETKVYENAEYNKAAILGNYVKLVDLNDDNKADLLKVVKFKDGASKWDASMEWIDGIGLNADPSVSDEQGRKMFLNAEYRIPMGQRLLEGYGLGDYSGTTDISIPAKQNTYYKDYDFYNVKSSKNLTILTNYKTQLQTTGWTCVLSSALSALEWYGQRGDLNEEDLAALRSDTRKQMRGKTSLRELENVFKNLGELGLTCKWKTESSFDGEGAIEKIYDPEWLKAHLEAGHPVMTIWNSYGGHGQVIIGYDDMGTETTADDVLIMMDPYDTTDHNPDGYIIQSYERWNCGLSGDADDGISEVRYLVAYPEDESLWTYKLKRAGKGLPDVKTNTIRSNDKNKLDSKLLEQTKLDLAQLYADPKDDELNNVWLSSYNEELGVAGPLAWNRYADYNYSPYYNFYDYYNGNGPTKTLKILKNYKTIQQSTEWTCGCTSALMVMEWFGMNKGETPKTDLSLSKARQDGEYGPTFLSGMKQIFSGDEWVYFTAEDLQDGYTEESYIGGYCLQAGTDPEWPGLIPYLIDNGIPMMIGSDDWGGHWQTIIGYDDMGTPGTQDDVLILADSYDTTDHDMDGYYVKSFERLVYGWDAQFEAYDNKWANGHDNNNFIVAFPKVGYENVIKELGLK